MLAINALDGKLESTLRLARSSAFHFLIYMRRSTPMAISTDTEGDQH
jgi:hypothetical protein